MMKVVGVKPFIKWAGGKGQLLQTIREKYPENLGRTINKYCEPFVGGGAVLFDILSNYDINEVLMNDINGELINGYKQIKENVLELVSELDKMQEKFWPLEKEERKEMYLEMREKFNYLKVNGDGNGDEEIKIKKAALFIFLNKTCFNGLFRVNKRGLFNVPMGAYKKPLICDRENLMNINELLQDVNIKCGAYQECLAFIDDSTFVYIDPPYRPLNQTSSFTAYSENAFNDKEQVELRDFVNSIHSKGAEILISNSDPKNVDKNDNFFDELYRKYNIERVAAKRMINSNRAKRGTISELLINNG